MCSRKSDTRNKKVTKCPCHYIDAVTAIKTMIKLRKQRESALKTELKSEMTKKRRNIIKEFLNTLEVKKTNQLFVYSDGKVATTATLRYIAKEMCKANKILDSHHSTAYSFRIGGTTIASMQGIDHPFILRYVGWAESRLGDCSQRYMRYSNYELSTMMYQMIHGPLRNDGFVGNAHQSNRTCAPWSEMTKFGKYATNCW